MGEEETTIADGAETTLDVSTDPVPDSDFASSIPEAYRERPWAKELTSSEEMFKMLDETKTLVGKRPAGIPQDTAPSEEWSEFNKAFGVPEKAEEYKFVEPGEGQEVNPEFQKGIADIMHKAGVSQKQLGLIEPAFNELVSKLAGEAGGDSEQANADFDKLALDTFGTREEEVMKNGKALIAKYIPESMKTHQESISNENLIILAGVLDGITKEFISEDRIPDGGNVVGPVTQADKEVEGRRLMMTDEYRDAFNPGHDAMQSRVNKLFGTE